MQECVVFFIFLMRFSENSKKDLEDNNLYKSLNGQEKNYFPHKMKINFARYPETKGCLE